MKSIPKASVAWILGAGLSIGILFFPDMAPAETAPTEEEIQGQDVSEDWEEFKDPFSEEEQQLVVRDPLQPFNRGMFWFNDKLYLHVLKPVARVYRGVPEPVRTSVGNFFDNLASPARFVNSLLQFKFEGAARELGRFLLNSTVGLAGFLDPAEDHHLEPSREDLGQTFGRYGIGSGFYLVLPALGPSTLRDGIGRFGDSYLDPVPYVMTEWQEYGAVKAFDAVNNLSLDDDTYEKIKEQALDPYLFLRNSYIQRRQALIRK